MNLRSTFFFFLFIGLSITSMGQLCTLCDGLGQVYEKKTYWDYNVIQKRKNSSGGTTILYDQKYLKREYETKQCPACNGLGIYHRRKATVVKEPERKRPASTESKVKEIYGGRYNSIERIRYALFEMENYPTSDNMLMVPGYDGRAEKSVTRYTNLDGSSRRNGAGSSPFITLTKGSYNYIYTPELDLVYKTPNEITFVGRDGYIFESTRETKGGNFDQKHGFYVNILTKKRLTLGEDYAPHDLRDRFWEDRKSKINLRKIAWQNDQLILAAKYDLEGRYGFRYRYGFVDSKDKTIVPFIYDDFHSVDEDAGIIRMIDKYGRIHSYTLDGKEINADITEEEICDGERLVTIVSEYPADHAMGITTGKFLFLTDAEGRPKIDFAFSNHECPNEFGYRKVRILNKPYIRYFNSDYQAFTVGSYVFRREAGSNWLRTVNLYHLEHLAEGGEIGNISETSIDEKKGQYGLIRYGKKIVNTAYDRISYHDQNSTWGATTSEGKVQNTAVMDLPDGIPLSPTFILENEKGGECKCGYADFGKAKTSFDKCSPTLALGFRLVQNGASTAIVKSDDHQTKAIFRKVDLANCNENYATVQNSDGRWGAISLQETDFGKTIVPFEYDNISMIADGAFVARDGSGEKVLGPGLLPTGMYLENLKKMKRQMPNLPTYSLDRTYKLLVKYGALGLAEKFENEKLVNLTYLSDGRILVDLSAGEDIILDDPKVKEVAFPYDLAGVKDGSYGLPVRYEDGRWGLCRIRRSKEKEGLELFNAGLEEHRFSGIKPLPMRTGNSKNPIHLYTAFTDGFGAFVYFRWLQDGVYFVKLGE